MSRKKRRTGRRRRKTRRTRLTLRQSRFVAALLGPACGNATLACRLSGYQGSANSLAVQGSRNMKNPAIRCLIHQEAEEMLKPGLDAYRQALHATTREVFLFKGELLYSEPQPCHRVRMDAADRVIELLERSTPVEDEGTEPHATDPKSSQEAELEAKITSLQPAGRNAVRRALELDEKLVEAEDELSEENDGPDRSSEK